MGAAAGKFWAGAAALALLAGCEDGRLDFDLRNLSSSGFDTSASLMALPDRPAPDARGVISYPNFQVVVAQRGETVRQIAGRLGLNAEELGSYNGITADTPLRRDEIIALPGRVSEPSPATGAPTTGPILPAAAAAGPAVETTVLAPAGTPTPAPSATPSAPAPSNGVMPLGQTGEEPLRHRVEPGETVYTIARRYGVPPEAIAAWNGLDGNLDIREGQVLLIPQGSAAAVPTASLPPEPAGTTTEPGAGSPTPVPPSAAAPLPIETPAPAAEVAEEPAPEEAPDLGAEQAAPADDSRLSMPVDGSIIREYAPGRNDGIDIAAAAGSPVRAADSGTVAAVTTDTGGINIVIVRHSDELLTVYTRIDNLTISQGQSVSRGQQIGQVAPGDPANLHFEVRLGLDSADPADYLP
ncbi:peptidoglycan DD-metalloendopeptidase family protein [Pseudoroseicyclus tamaricis]|uniref:Peptidoglycan DD-metalloendopeptidase family protein n=1 Tax=Pseudoroseicyclus tamaricis TaxID=2705421 RepID=A0A6B2JT92_9RHOB|nr:peptidoglycan DD-metalloendopeptidase family protein [Pseudoroseicyclus tamaricis]NDV01468.1 peptidoglycan DD-metalloendopeptidase family protein [Pseudoroseicyclus tamaricis]